MTNYQMKVVYQILPAHRSENEERGKEKKERWIRIGTAFVNRDGSLNAYLDAIPRDGKIHIRSQSSTTKKEEVQ